MLFIIIFGESILNDAIAIIFYEYIKIYISIYKYIYIY
jgi:NhaP-type Na+/H+ or K+/H+ antiporter